MVCPGWGPPWAGASHGFSGTSRSAGILQSLPFHSSLSLLKNPTQAGTAVCGFEWGTTHEPKKAFSKITVFFNAYI